MHAQLAEREYLLGIATQRHLRKVNSAQQADAEPTIPSCRARISSPRARCVPEVWYFAAVPRRDVDTPRRNAVLSCCASQEREMCMNRVYVSANFREEKRNRSITGKGNGMVEIEVESACTTSVIRKQTRCIRTKCDVLTHSAHGTLLVPIRTAIQRQLLRAAGKRNSLSCAATLPHE